MFVFFSEFIFHWVMHILTHFSQLYIYIYSTHTHTHTHTHTIQWIYIYPGECLRSYTICATTFFPCYIQTVLPLALHVTHKVCYHSLSPLHTNKLCYHSLPPLHTNKLCYHIISPLHTLCYHIYFPLHTVGTATHLCFSLKCLFCCVNIQSIFVDI